MKKTHVLLVLAITIPLLVFQFSCATVEKKEVKEVPEKAEAPAPGKLLGDKHKDKGISCTTCHKAMPPKDDVASSICLACHSNYKEVTKGEINPHDAHAKYSRCTECHHMHKPSEVQCLACHEFKMKAP